MADGVERLVTVFDLRHELEDVLDRERLEQRLREAGREAGKPMADVSRLLVVDMARDLPTRQEAYMRLCSAAGLTPQVLCLAVGSPAQAGPEGSPDDPDDPDGPDGPPADRYVLTVPEQLSGSSPSTATLWVGDVRGVGWSPGQHDAVTLTASSMAPDDLQGLQPLLKLLQVPEVFDQVFRQLRDLPTPAACPALRLMVHEVPDEDLLRAQLQALEMCTDASAPQPSAAQATTGGALALLADLAEPEELSVPEALAGSTLRAACEDSEDALAEARADMADLAGLRALMWGSPTVGAVAHRLHRAADALIAQREQIEQTFVMVDGRIGLDEDAREILADIGVSLPSVPGTDKREVAGQLRQYVLTQLQRRRPLPEIVGWLRDFANRSVPAGSAAQIGRLKAVCPDALIEALSDLSPPAVGAGAPAAAGLVFVAAVCAALAPAGPVVAAVLLVLLLAGIARTVVSMGDGWDAMKQDGGLPVLWDAVPRAATALLAVSWAVGTAAGTVLAAVDRPPAVIGAAFLVAALLTVGAAVRTLWRTAVAGWREETRLDAAGVAVRGLTEALDVSMVKYWLLADAKADASDQAKALAELVQESCDALSDFAGQLGQARGDWVGDSLRTPGGTGVTVRAGSTPAVVHLGQAGPALQATVVGDFCDLVAEALEPFWNAAMDDPSGTTGRRVGTRTAELIHEYQQQLVRAGSMPPPRFARRQAERPDPATLVGIEPGRLLDMLAAGGDGASVQLCSPDQLRMLDRAPGSSRTFGFLPQALKGRLNRLGEAGPDGTGLHEAGPVGERGLQKVFTSELVWTASGRYAGFLRLVPLAARAVRPAGPGADEAPGAG